MRSHKLIEHTADVRLVVEGDSLQELFTAAVEGMAELILPSSCSSGTPSLSLSVKLSAPDVTSLLIDFLSDVLTLTHVHKAVICTSSFETLTETELVATVGGLSVDAFEEDVKAVTYHEANVHKNAAGNWECTIVFDI